MTTGGAFTLWFLENAVLQHCPEGGKKRCPFEHRSKFREIFSRGQGFSILPLIYSLIVITYHPCFVIPEGKLRRNVGLLTDCKWHVLQLT
jgi:hypothetical protein